MSAARTLRNQNQAFRFYRRGEGEDAPPKGAALFTVNEALVAKNKHLHPTRGWRKLSVRRTLITDITMRMKAGQHGFTGPMVKRILNREVFI